MLTGLNYKKELAFKDQPQKEWTSSELLALEILTHPDLLSTSYSDKSRRAAVLDDRLSNSDCPQQGSMNET